MSVELTMIVKMALLNGHDESEGTHKTHKHLHFQHIHSKNKQTDNNMAATRQNHYRQ